MSYMVVRTEVLIDGILVSSSENTTIIDLGEVEVDDE